MINQKRTDDALQKIAVKMRLLRRKAGLKQTTVVKETGLNIGSIEAAQKNINFTAIDILCKYYGITLEEFFDGLEL